MISAAAGDDVSSEIDATLNSRKFEERRGMGVHIYWVCRIG